jgi:pyruvate dehydrogenase E1 component beta subunit
MTQETKREITLGTAVNNFFKSFFETTQGGAFFGQNVISGSRISGLGSGMESVLGVTAFNTQNSENSLAGFGFGVALMGHSCVYLMKQHDFSLLQLDQLVNTKRLVKELEATGIFILAMVTVDTGYEGPQSNLHNLEDFVSLSATECILMQCETSVKNAKDVIRSPFAMIAIPQSFVRKSILSTKATDDLDNFVVYGDKDIFATESVLLINFGLVSESFLRIHDLANSIHPKVNSVIQSKIATNPIYQDLERFAQKFKAVVIVDVTKSRFTPAQIFYERILRNNIPAIYLHRENPTDWSRVYREDIYYDLEYVKQFLLEFL